MIDTDNIPENTLHYLENYLKPGRKWYNQIPPQERINHIRNARVDWATVSVHIRNMDYSNFLQTPYWKAISAHKKFKAGYRCQVCNSPNRLTTHHRNYGIHGYEHANMWELTVLCTHCHEQFHDQHRYKQTSRVHNLYSDESSEGHFRGFILLVTLFVITLVVCSSLNLRLFTYPT